MDTVAGVSLPFSRPVSSSEVSEAPGAKPFPDPLLPSLSNLGAHPFLLENPCPGVSAHLLLGLPYPAPSLPQHSSSTPPRTSPRTTPTAPQPAPLANLQPRPPSRAPAAGIRLPPHLFAALSRHQSELSTAPPVPT